MTYSKVKTRKVEKPAVGIPCPAGDGTIHDGSPAESKDHRRHDASAFERSTNDQLYGDSAEKHLIEAEYDFW